MHEGNFRSQILVALYIHYPFPESYTASGFSVLEKVINEYWMLPKTRLPRFNGFRVVSVSFGIRVPLKLPSAYSIHCRNKLIAALLII